MNTILIVDDEQDSLNLVRAQLQGLSCQTFTVLTTAEAMKILETQKIDLLITDIMFPGGANGLSLIELMDARYPKTQKIILTGYDVDYEYIFEHEDTFRLQKPYSTVELIVLVKRALKQRRGNFFNVLSKATKLIAPIKFLIELIKKSNKK